MTHYLRTVSGATVADGESSAEDLHVVVPIAAFSELLLARHGDTLVADFDGLQELRGEWFEATPSHETPGDLMGRRFQEVARRHGLAYITD